MKKKRNESPDPDMLDEYDFSGGVRGKYADRFPRDVRLVALDPDVAAAFSDAVAVNDALRGLLELVRKVSK